jgi:hypothetical protein
MNLTTMSIPNKIGDCSEYPDGRLCSTLAVRCKKSVHNTENERVCALVDWVYVTELRTMYQRKHDLKIYIVTSKKTHG